MIKYKCKSLFHFISSTLLLNNINEEWRKMKMNVKNSSQNTVKKYEELTFTDDFMFCKVMQNNPDLCKHLIELKGIAFILRNLTDSEDEMFSIINTGNYSAEKYRKKYRKNHKKYINYINEILDDKANGYFTNIEALDEKEALINYKFQLKEQFANGKCTNDYFRIVNSIIHMYCNRLTGNRELEEEYFALVRHALYHIKERSELDILK